MKSSKDFFIQRWHQCFCLHSTPNTWISKLDEFLTIRHFPCLEQIDVKDDSMDKIRITIEIIEENTIIKRYGPVGRGKYFKKRKS